VARTPTAEEVIAARHPEDVLGDDPKASYRKLARALHPDNLDSGDEEAFKALHALWLLADDALRRGTYGKRESVAEVLVTTRRHAYKVSGIFARGDASVLYRATYPDEDGTRRALLKVVRDPKDGPQLMHEAKVLREMLTGNSEIADALAPYLPRYIEAFGYQHDGTRRQGLAFSETEGLVSLHAIEAAFPDGLFPKDSAWMLRRLLLTLGLAHGLGWSHLHLSRSHVLVHPEEHGLVLVDWRGAAPATPARQSDDAWHAVYLIDKLTRQKGRPRRLANFFDGCERLEPKRLPNALTLREEFTELIEDLWGKRTFRPFTMTGRSP
jgi:hypothetical protein